LLTYNRVLGLVVIQLYAGKCKYKFIRSGLTTTPIRHAILTCNFSSDYGDVR